MRVCDFVAKFIHDIGINDVFMVSGGGLMYLTDGLACNEDLNVICCHHEQAAAMAAVAYAKYLGNGCCYVTTGCGGTNTITGVLNAWQDNTPCIFISGQCKRNETLQNVGIPTRQIGVQEADIVKIVESITKYSVMVNNADEILYHLEKAAYIAKIGRPGPVWIDIPMDIQSADVDIPNLKHFEKFELEPVKTEITPLELEQLIVDFNNSKRPIIIAGHGIRLANAIDAFDKLIHRHNIPFVCSRLGTDILPTNDNLNIGRIGNKGMRSANFALQNADYVLVLGSRLSVSSTGQEYSYFARNAKVTVVDIDKYEHLKNTVHIEQIINADVKDVLNKLSLNYQINYKNWADKCLSWKKKYPVCLKEYYEDSNGINLYAFMEELSKCFREDSVLIGDAGSAVYVPPQGINTTTKHQRYITSGAQAEMGFSLPAAIGVVTARKNREVLAITGDGSLQMNIQELQTIVHHNFNIKLFVWNNDGYLSIRATQNKFFNGRFIGTDNTSGVSFPNLKKIANAYGIKYVKIDSIGSIHKKISELMEYTGPVICEVMCIRDQLIIPTVSSKQLENGKLVSCPIEDMYPFLERKEFNENMIISTINPNP